MEIQHAIAHRVSKARGARGAISHPAGAELERSEELRELLTTVLDSYNNRSSRYSGSFEPDEENYRFSVWVQQFVQEEISFLDFSELALERLRLKIADINFAGGGYLVLICYRQQQRDMLLVAKLNAQAGAIFSEDLHRVVRASYLNLERLQVAARIDLTSWRQGESRYLTFVLKRSDDEGPSDYFQDFVGCTVDQDSKIESTKLVAVVREFASERVSENLLAEEQVPELQRRAYDYAIGLKKTENPQLSSFEALANAVWPENPAHFLTFLNNHPDPPSAGFSPDGKVLRRLSNISFKSRELSVVMTYDFRQQHVRTNGRQIIIEDAPDKLLQELAS